MWIKHSNSNSITYHIDLDHVKEIRTYADNGTYVIKFFFKNADSNDSNSFLYKDEIQRNKAMSFIEQELKIVNVDNTVNL